MSLRDKRMRGYAAALPHLRAARAAYQAAISEPEGPSDKPTPPSRFTKDTSHD